jgi:RNA polymerase sigma-70 factor (ECF subfamily)
MSPDDGAKERCSGSSPISNGPDAALVLTSWKEAPSSSAAGPPERTREQRIRLLVLDNLDFVARALRNFGTPPMDVDDAVQSTFIAAVARLDSIEPGCEKGFLFKIALRVAAHARRSFARRREVRPEAEEALLEMRFTPEDLSDQKRMRAMLDAILDQMPLDLRTVFVLHEFEELTMAEIAKIVDIAPGTVASRLRRARQEFRARAKRSLLQKVGTEGDLLRRCR